MAFKSKRTLRAIAAVLVVLLAASAASAQLQPPEAESVASATGYREGASWIAVTRIRSRADGMTDVLWGRAGRAFRGALGRDAIIQLAASANAARVFAKADVKSTKLGHALDIYRVRGRFDVNEDGLMLAARLAQLPEVVRAIPDLALPRKRASIAIPPNDEHYSAQWYLDRIAIEDAWQLTTGSRDTSIVVVDNGCDMNHPDLRDAFVGGRDVRDEDDDPSPDPGTDGNAHGTACAGIIAAAADNETGIAGVCPECSLHCVRLLDDSDPPFVPVSADIAAFTYALDVNAAVVSNSWGFEEEIEVPEILAFAIVKVATEGRDGLGAVIVFAAGNDNRELSTAEITGLPGVITVGAINNFDEVAPFSNRGVDLDVTAPLGTYTTDIAGPDGDDPGDYTHLFGGTSSACPVVSGIAGLMLSANPELTSTEVADYLTETARPAPFGTPDEDGHDLVYGYGIVDPEAAVRRALGLPDVVDAMDAGAAEPDAATSDGGDDSEIEAAAPAASGGCSVAIVK